MGFRFRKSVNMGPLRINFSKSGVGYSVGSSGLRYTKTARGTTRTTATLPGTGVSYVKEHGRRELPTASKITRTAASGTPPVAIPMPQPNDPEEMNALAREIRNYRQTLKEFDFWTAAAAALGAICCISVRVPVFSVLLVVSVFLVAALLVARNVYKKKQKVQIVYEETAEYFSRGAILTKIFTAIMKCEAVYHVSQGRGMHRIYPKTEKPRNIETNAAAQKIGWFYLLPDMLYFDDMDYPFLLLKDVHVIVAAMQHTTTTPTKDCDVIAQTWLHTNKDGSRDLRYKENPPVFTCLYGLITLQTQYGFVEKFALSNLHLAREIEALIAQMRE